MATKQKKLLSHDLELYGVPCLGSLLELMMTQFHPNFSSNEMRSTVHSTATTGSRLNKVSMFKLMIFSNDNTYLYHYNYEYTINVIIKRTLN